MRYASPFAVVLVASVLTTACLAEDTKPAKTLEGKVDKTVAKPKCEGKEPRIWAEVDYYGLFSLEAKRPGFALLTAQAFHAATNPDKPGYRYYGELSSSDVMVRYAKDEESYGWSHGFKGALGGWIDAEEKWGAQISGFVSPTVSTGTTLTGAASGTSIFTSVPFYNAQKGYEDAVLLGFSFPNFESYARMSISSSQDIWGVGASGLRNLIRNKNITLDGTFGFRYLNLSEEFNLDYSSDYRNRFDTANLSSWLSGGTINDGWATARDSVETSNHFYGANIGARFSYTINRFILDIRPQLSFGAMDETVKVSGFGNIVDTTGATVLTSNGAIFARPGSIGETNKVRFAFMPEVEVKVGVRITKNVQFKVGYDFLYISDVVRAGNQLSRNLNSPKDGFGSLTGTATGRAKPFETDDFMAHGVTAGFTIRF